MRQEMTQRQEEMDRQREQMLETLKTVDPSGYERQKAQFERQKRIRAIVTAFADKQIDATAARAQLQPLVQAEVESQRGALDAQIVMLRKQLEELEGFKRDPAAYVQRQIDLHLGLVQPMPPGGPGGSAALPDAPPSLSPLATAPEGSEGEGKVLIKKRGSGSWDATP